MSVAEDEAERVEHPAGGILRDLARRARSKQAALFPGNEDRVGYWLTPPEVMEPLHEEFGFTFDACPFPRPAGFDGLSESWGDVSYCNPPFVSGGRRRDSSRTAWVRKAIAEAEMGKTAVLVLGVDRYLTLLARAGAEFRALPDFRWLDERGNPQGASLPSMAFVLRGRRVA